MWWVRVCPGRERGCSGQSGASGSGGQTSSTASTSGTSGTSGGAGSDMTAGAGGMRRVAPEAQVELGAPLELGAWAVPEGRGAPAARAERAEREAQAARGARAALEGRGAPAAPEARGASSCALLVQRRLCHRVSAKELADAAPTFVPTVAAKTRASRSKTPRTTCAPKPPQMQMQMPKKARIAATRCAAPISIAATRCSVSALRPAWFALNDREALRVARALHVVKSRQAMSAVRVAAMGTKPRRPRCAPTMRGRPDGVERDAPFGRVGHVGIHRGIGDGGLCPREER